MTGLLRLSLRLALSLLWIAIIFFPLFLTTLSRRQRANSILMMIAFHVGSLLWGVRVTRIGTISRNRPLLIVSNHFSYLDVFALGGILPVRFTPKSEIASWPGIGFMCKITGCLFIDRRPSRTLDNKRKLDESCRNGDIISLFPEGTTNDGTDVLPFKSSFFSLAEQAPLTVQPLTVLYTALGGQPIGDAERPQVGWYGDASFFPHLLHYLKQKNVDVTLIFHDPVDASAFASRKELAARCQRIIAESIQKNAPGANAGGKEPNNGG